MFTAIPLPCAATCGTTSCPYLIGAKKFVSNAFRAVSRSTPKTGLIKNIRLVPSHNRKQAYQDSVIDHYIYMTRSPKHFVDDALQVRLSSSVTFKRVYQKRNEYNPDLVPIPDSKEITFSIFS